MRLDDYIESLEPDEEAERRRLAKEKSYAITEHLEEFEHNFERALSGDTLVGSTAPSIFVGRSNYPDIPIGVLSPVGDEDAAEEYVTDGDCRRLVPGFETDCGRGKLNIQSHRTRTQIECVSTTTSRA